MLGDHLHCSRPQQVAHNNKRWKEGLEIGGGLWCEILGSRSRGRKLPEREGVISIAIKNAAAARSM